MMAGGYGDWLYDDKILWGSFMVIGVYCCSRIVVGGG